jgi:hypothetical protein
MDDPFSDRFLYRGICALPACAHKIEGNDPKFPAGENKTVSFYGTVTQT